MRNKTFRIIATFTVLIPYWILVGCVFILFPIGTICGIGCLFERMFVEPDRYSSSIGEILFLIFLPITAPILAMRNYIVNGNFEL